MKLFRILRAWWYVLLNRNHKEAARRAKICSYCNLIKWGVCMGCGCPVIAKSRLMDESCPHPDGDKWK